MRVEEGFQQTPCSDDAPYTSDPVLQSLLKRILPPRIHDEVDLDLQRVEKEIVRTVRPLSELTYPPSVTQYNQWGQRVDTLHTSEGWRGLKAFAQKEGIIAIPYERKQGEYSRIFAFMKMVLMNGDGQVIFCPLAMTDGSARVVELYGNLATKEDVFSRLISRDPSIAFTAGQWMTERPGGSDVSQTETTATPTPSISSPYGPVYKLDGFKWFSSATDSNVAVALARSGTPAEGSRGLSLFLVPLRLPLLPDLTGPPPDPTSNNIYIHRLKQKFGTQIVPTAELTLQGAQAYQLGPAGAGVKCIAPVLAITRVYSGIASLGALRKALALARSFAAVRAINGGTQLLADTPLHVAQLARVALVYRALAHFAFSAVHLLGRTECGRATRAEALRFRLLNPAVKAFAAEMALPAMEECMAALGGQGYMEENVIGRLVRDTMVEKIWEGTAAVLSLDLLRSMKVEGAWDAFLEWGTSIVTSVPKDLQKKLQQPIDLLKIAIKELETAYKPPIHPLVPRAALFLFSHIASSLYLLEHAVWSCVSHQADRETDVEAFIRWVKEGGLNTAQEDVKRILASDATRSRADKALVYKQDARSRSKL